MPRLRLIDKSLAGGGGSPLGAVDLIETDAEKHAATAGGESGFSAGRRPFVQKSRVLANFFCL